MHGCPSAAKIFLDLFCGRGIVDGAMKLQPHRKPERPRVDFTSSSDVGSSQRAGFLFTNKLRPHRGAPCVRRLCERPGVPASGTPGIFFSRRTAVPRRCMDAPVSFGGIPETNAAGKGKLGERRGSIDLLRLALRAKVRVLWDWRPSAKPRGLQQTSLAAAAAATPSDRVSRMRRQRGLSEGPARFCGCESEGAQQRQF